MICYFVWFGFIRERRFGIVHCYSFHFGHVWGGSNFVKLCKLKSVKLAASVAMNSHYHPYADISSPHPPSPDNNNFASSMAIGGGHHHNGHGPIMNAIGGQQQGFHQLNNNNSMLNKCAGCGSKYLHSYYFILQKYINRRKWIISISINIFTTMHKHAIRSLK